METKDIPSIIRDARIRKNMTLAQVSAALGYKSYQVAQRWESGARPVPDEKKRDLAKLLNLTVDDLVP